MGSIIYFCFFRSPKMTAQHILYRGWWRAMLTSRRNSSKSIPTSLVSPTYLQVSGKLNSLQPTYLQVSGEFNTLWLWQNGCHFADDIRNCIFLNENVSILFKISLKFVVKVWINNIPALVQIMAYHRSGDKPLSEPMLVSLLTHICVTWPQWLNWLAPGRFEWNFCNM